MRGSFFLSVRLNGESAGLVQRLNKEGIHELRLELSQLANFDDTDYDEELKNSIKDSLKLGSEDITNELRKNSISTTKLLAGFVKKEIWENT